MVTGTLGGFTKGLGLPHPPTPPPHDFHSLFAIKNPAVSVWFHRPAYMAWLYYSDYSDKVLEDASIPDTFTHNSFLNLWLAQYNLSGHFLGFFNASNHNTFLCESSKKGRLKFGTQARKEVCNYVYAQARIQVFC